jgi:hypothetical protein
MTEAEWLASENPQLMLREGIAVLSEKDSLSRQRDLLCVACARLMWHLLAEDVKAAMEWKEATAGRGYEDDYEAWEEHGRNVKYATDCDGTREQIMAPYIVEAAWLSEFSVAFHHLCRLSFVDSPRRLADLLRDIFGNPFRPVTFDPACRTSTVIALASQMYESRDFSTMPILADALQDAGCDNEDVLNHCRDAKQTHVRGCWVVDLVLGKA